MTSHLQKVSFNESIEHFYQENTIYDDRLLSRLIQITFLSHLQ